MSRLNKETLEIKQQIDLDAQLMTGLKATYTKAIQTEKVLNETRKNIFEKNNKLTMLPGAAKSQRISNLLTDISQGYASISAAHSKYVSISLFHIFQSSYDRLIKSKIMS